LNDLIDEYGTPDFIKISATGTEYTVLQGLDRLLEDTLICFDVYEEFLDTTKQGIAYMHELGYNQFGIVEGLSMVNFPNAYHAHEAFNNKLKQAFPSPGKDFLGRIFVNYEGR
jgi:hypothetical protein